MRAEPLRVYLERIDPEANMRRFYYAYIGPTFAGPVCVVRIHGRKGVWQRTLAPLVFEDETAAVNSRVIMYQPERECVIDVCK